MPAVLIVMMLLTAAVPATSDSRYEMAIASLRRGQEALRLEHWQDAEEQFTLAIGYDPSLEMAHYGLGQAYTGRASIRRRGASLQALS